MSRDQILTLALLAALIALFLWDRLRYDVVALTALLAAVAAGVVRADDAFNGFANPVLPLIAAALVISAAIGQSGAVEIFLRRMAPLMRSKEVQVGTLVACVALLSAFMKNIGALAIFIAAAIQLARRSGRSPSEFLMPLSFASLLGGSMTLIGTSPNLLISAVRQELTGQPFHMFDFTPVGAGIAVFGIAFLAVGWRLLPRGLRGSASPAFAIEDYTSELRLPQNSPFVGRTVGEVETLSGGEIGVAALIRHDGRRQIPTRRWKLYADDILVVEADPQVIEQFARDGNLALVGSEVVPEKAAADALDGAAAGGRPGERPGERPGGAPAPRARAAASQAEAPARERAGDDELAIVEAVVAAGSDLIGRSAAGIHLRDRYGVNLLAIARRGRLRASRLQQARFQLGDAIVLQGYANRLPDVLVALGCLPLAERPLKLGRRRRLWLPLAILAAAIAVSGLEWVPAAIAFTGAALALVLLRAVPLKEAYAAVEWPILVLIGALIPIGEAVQHNGTATLLATGLAAGLAHVPSYVALGALLAATMLLTPILHHAATVLVMGPIAASLAQQLGLRIDPFLMAVAVGAGSDFLTPIGHQSNTLVMGLGGYRFGDYWKLGLPLSLMVLVLGVPLIMLVWPVR
ncbi:MAG TPA: SLC13 family permease [Stellaceae bacterium]|nr:SLC13 family permease [Stellaceae bacterium]